MKRTILGMTLLTALAGCVAYGPAGGGYGGPVAGDAYYDGYYGPIVTGYWGPDRVFHFEGRDHRWRRDTDRHFRRAAGRGFRHVHFAAHPRPDKSDRH